MSFVNCQKIDWTGCMARPFEVSIPHMSLCVNGTWGTVERCLSRCSGDVLPQTRLCDNDYRADGHRITFCRLQAWKGVARVFG